MLRVLDITAGGAESGAAVFEALNWSTLPLLLYFVFRRYLQGMNLAKPVMFALVSANLVNLVGQLGAGLWTSWDFARWERWGRGGPRAWRGSTWRAYCWLMRFITITAIKRGCECGAAAEFSARLAAGVSGIAGGDAIGLEVGVFAVATVLIGRLGAVPLASHQVALNTVSLTYMVPLGISAAAAVRVGQALGRNDPHGASRSGWTAMLLGTDFHVLHGDRVLDGAAADCEGVHAGPGRDSGGEQIAVCGGVFSDV